MQNSIHTKTSQIGRASSASSAAMTSVEPQSESLSHLRHEDQYENEKGAEDVSPTESEVITYPEGGLRAWSVALGTAGNLFCTFGYVNAFG